MAVSNATLWRDPVFRAGLLLRIAAVVLLVPQIQHDWFVPFLAHAVAEPGLDPWSSFLAAGGTALAYPYGPVMLLAHLPGVLPGALAAALSGEPYLIGVGFRAALLAADVAALALLHALLPGAPRRLLWLYWWSPLVLYVTYWNGQTDIVPVALLLGSLLLLERHRAAASGALLGLAAAAKLSMLLAVPFFLIYLWRNKRLRALLPRFALGGAGVGALLLAPWLASSGFTAMVLGTREFGRLFDLAVPIGSEYRLYLTPTLFLLALYGIWRLRRSSFELLIATTGLAFFLIVLGTPAPPGWYLWLVPFLVAHQLQADRSAVLLTAGFSTLVIAMHVLLSSGAALPLLGLDPQPALAALGAATSAAQRSLWITLVIAAGLVLLAQMLRERVARNDYFRIAQKPLVIGIAGDSGSGKDTLSRSLAGLFGEHSVVHVSGDDYHVWDRHGPMWQGLTHLNPRANDLLRFHNDVLALIDGKRILCRRYDHEHGRFQSPSLLDKNDVIIASGLHALQQARLRRRYDVGIYLDLDESLRRRWKLDRDVGERGHAHDNVLASLARRAPDAERYVHPQRAAAGLVLRLEPVNPRHLEAAPAANALPLKLVATLRNSAGHERVARVLIGICGLHLDVQAHDDAGEVELTIEGDVAAEDVSLAARHLVPDLQEMLDVRPHWRDGMNGIMQLLVLTQVEESLRSRIAWAS